MLQQLRKMEGEIQALRKEMHSGNSGKQDDAGGQSDLVGNLKKLLKEERQRNAVLMRKYSRLEMKFEALLRVKKRLEAQ